MLQTGKIVFDFASQNILIWETASNYSNVLSHSSILKRFLQLSIEWFTILHHANVELIITSSKLPAVDLQVSLVITKSCFPVPDCGASLRHECLIFTFESYILLNQLSIFSRYICCISRFSEMVSIMYFIVVAPAVATLHSTIFVFSYDDIYSLIFVSYQKYSFPQSEYVPFHNFERVNPLSFQSSRIHLEFIFQWRSPPTFASA